MSDTQAQASGTVSAHKSATTTMLDNSPGSALRVRVPESVIFGSSDTMRTLRNKAEKVATANVPVLIRGESGTGKDVMAQLLHEWSPWNAGPFIKINCPAVP